MEKNPYDIIKCRHITEKTTTLANLAASESNPSVRRCTNPKVVFIVDKRANKQEIAWAIETIYSAKNIRVTDVNTINVKPKWRRVRGRLGKTTAFKKAVITLQPGDTIDE